MFGRPEQCIRRGGRGRFDVTWVLRQAQLSRPYAVEVPNLNTIALELVPPNVDPRPSGRERALEDARKVVQYAGEYGLTGRIRHVIER